MNAQTILTFYLLLTASMLAGWYYGTLTLPEQTRQHVIEEREKIRALPALRICTLIFYNNFYVMLPMFIPVIGVIYAIHVAFNTGIIFSAIIPSNTYLLLFLLTHPVPLLELTAYSIALSIGWKVMRKLSTKDEDITLTTFLNYFVASVAVLLLAAVVETYVIVYSICLL